MSAGIRVRDVVRDIVVEFAEEERFLVAALERFDDAVVMRRLRRRRGRGAPLGFGLDQAATLVTPVVWLAVGEAARRIGASAGDGASAGLKGVLRKIARRKAPLVVVAPLTSEQLALVHRLAVETGTRRGLSEQRATAIADGVVTRLATGEIEGAR